VQNLLFHMVLDEVLNLARQHQVYHARVCTLLTSTTAMNTLSLHSNSRQRGPPETYQRRIDAYSTTCAHFWWPPRCSARVVCSRVTTLYASRRGVHRWPFPNVLKGGKFCVRTGSCMSPPIKIRAFCALDLPAPSHKGWLGVLPGQRTRLHTVTSTQWQILGCSECCWVAPPTAGRRDSAGGGGNVQPPRPDPGG
jgi:hypothetical protein